MSFRKRGKKARDDLLIGEEVPWHRVSFYCDRYEQLKATTRKSRYKLHSVSCFLTPITEGHTQTKHKHTLTNTHERFARVCAHTHSHTDWHLYPVLINSVAAFQGADIVGDQKGCSDSEGAGGAQFSR
jgi:hypothetical protein